MKVIDNFLPEKEFKALQTHIMGVDFPWFYYEGITGNDKVHYDQWSLFHLFYQNAEPNSNSFKNLGDFLDKLDINAIHRIKANLYPRTQEIIEHDLHVDLVHPHKGALLGLNTNDGYTIMEDGAKVKSVANRAILFDPGVMHGSTTCTDENCRVNIIVNYF